MSKGSTHCLNPEDLSSSSCLLIPARLRASDLQYLMEVIGSRKILWLVEESDHIDPQVKSIIESSGASGMSFSSSDPTPEGVGITISSQLASDTIAIFVPGTSLARSGMAVHISGKTLRFLGQLGLAVQTLAVLLLT